MPLIECLDCTGKVSDKAPACPHCGCPASALKANLKQQFQTSGTAKYPPSDPVADSLKENLKQPKSSSRELGKHKDSLRKNREWLALCFLSSLYLTSFLNWTGIMIVVWVISLWAASAYHSKKISEYQLLNKTILAKDSKGLFWWAFGVFLATHLCLVVVYTVIHAIAN